jgi:hypothetical protein
MTCQHTYALVYSPDHNTPCSRCERCMHIEWTKKAK